MDVTTINAIDVSSGVQPNTEQIQPTVDNLYVSMSDSDYITSVNSQISTATGYWNGLKVEQRRLRNYKYWVGQQIKESELRDDLERGVDNAIFRNIDTFISYANARVPELTVTPTYKNEQTRSFAQGIARILPTEWELLQKMQPLMGQGILNHQINLLAVYQVGYDPDTEEFWTDEISATDMVISKDGSFIGRYIKDATVGDLLERFPEKKAEILGRYGLSPLLNAPKSILDSDAEYLETWTDTMVGWKLGDIVLGKMQNPHFDYVGQDIQMGDGTTAKVKFNHFKKPKSPFIFLTYYNRGIHVMDDTTLIEQAIGPQDWVNKRKRQIGANADSTNGHWVSSGDYISKEEFDKITGGIDEKIWLENGMPADGLQKLTGNPLPDYIYNDLIDSRNVIDNLMGTHSVSRGEKSGNDTLGQDVLQKDGDTNRMDGYVRNGIERFAQAWYEWMYHLYLVYKIEETSLAIPEDDDFETDNVLFSRSLIPLVQKKNGDVIPVPLVFRVKQGSTLPKDDVAEYFKAKEMKDVLMPIDFFKKMGEPNPRELTRNLLIWQTDPFYFFKDDKEMQQMLQQKQQADAMAQQQTHQNAMQLKQAAPPDPNAPQESTENEPPQGQHGGAQGESTPQGVGKALRALLQQGPGQGQQGGAAPQAPMV